MARRETEAERLARCRTTFERACRDNITMDEAKRRIALEQIELRRRAIAELRGETWRRPHSAPGPQQQFYWQRGDLA